MGLVVQAAMLRATAPIPNKFVNFIVRVLLVHPLQFLFQNKFPGYIFAYNLLFSSLYIYVMKKFISIICMLSFLFFFESCSSQSNMDPQVVTALVNSQDFSFHAQRANPTNYDVINIANSMPNVPATRIFDLTGSNYSIDVKPNNLEVVLPYFGRVFNPTYGSTNQNSYRFTSKDFTVNKSQNKKGRWIIKIKPNDVRTVDEIIIEVSKSGQALTSISSNDRQPISYDGYITKNEDQKVQP